MRAIYFFLLIICLIGIANACDNSNSFVYGEDINVCLDTCIMQNVSNSTQYYNCDTTTSCFLTIRNLSGTRILNSSEMTRNISTETSFNYSIGNFTLYNQSFIGEYTCNFLKGISTNRFNIDLLTSTLPPVIPISGSGTPAGGGGGGGGGIKISQTQAQVATNNTLTPQNNTDYFLGLIKDNLIWIIIVIGAFMLILVGAVLFIIDRTRRLKKNSK